VTNVSHPTETNVKYQKKKGFSRKVTSEGGRVKVTRVLGTSDEAVF
jgi:hypothetical protein